MQRKWVWGRQPLPCMRIQLSVAQENSEITKQNASGVSRSVVSDS